MNRLRFVHLVEKLHALGPRATGELLLEIAAGADLQTRLEDFASLDPRIVHTLGADRFPPPPLRRVA